MHELHACVIGSHYTAALDAVALTAAGGHIRGTLLAARIKERSRRPWLKASWPPEGSKEWMDCFHKHQKMKLCAMN